jgi:Spy/CpxP family protein refolding chaperone
LEQRIRAQMGRLMRERLGLTDEQATGLGQVVETFEGRRRELFREEQEARRRVDELTEEATPDPGEAAVLLDRMVSLRQQEAALFAEEQDALREILTPVQILELHALRAQIGQRIRALRGGRNGGERRRGGVEGSKPLGVHDPVGVGLSRPSHRFEADGAFRPGPGRPG